MTVATGQAALNVTEGPSRTRLKPALSFVYLRALRGSSLSGQLIAIRPLNPFPKNPFGLYTSAREAFHMSATIVWRAVLISLLLVPCVAAQNGGNQSTTTCNLDDGRQVYIRYTPVSAKQERFSNGKPWARSEERRV